ncbi:hypothetical protein HDU98_000774 [Podochytrium sp. JEL0797]|nr:hypothetical protein HDU98_000774 [Podochytrium sp. JEL0797]
MFSKLLLLPLSRQRCRRFYSARPVLNPQLNPSIGNTTPPNTTTLARETLLKSLCDSGFTEPQSEALLSLISNAINESTVTASEELVQKHELDRFSKQSHEDMSKLKMDLRNLSVLDYGDMRVEVKRIAKEVDRLRDVVTDDVNKTHGGIRLDLNLEKKRISNEVDALEQLVLNAESKIEREMSELVRRIEKMRKDLKQGFNS